MKIQSGFSRDRSQIVEKCRILQCWRVLQKIARFGSRCWQLPDFIGYSLYTVSPLGEIHEDLVIIRYVKLQTDKR